MATYRRSGFKVYLDRVYASISSGCFSAHLREVHLCSLLLGSPLSLAADLTWHSTMIENILIQEIIQVRLTEQGSRYVLNRLTISHIFITSLAHWCGWLKLGDIHTGSAFVHWSTLFVAFAYTHNILTRYHCFLVVRDFLQRQGSSHSSWYSLILAQRIGGIFGLFAPLGPVARRSIHHQFQMGGRRKYV